MLEAAGGEALRGVHGGLGNNWGELAWRCGVRHSGAVYSPVVEKAYCISLATYYRWQTVYTIGFFVEAHAWV